MKIEIEVVSTMNIKPSSPTPSHLQRHDFSFLDQLAPPIIMPMVFFYHRQETSGHLKTTLSDALSLFYPLAGRVVDNTYINCNDNGVPYVEARCNSQISDVLSDTNPNELSKFFPCELDDVRDLPMVIQTTFFQGGGMAVAIGISHKVADACSYFLFVNSWAAVSRRDHDGVVPPMFGSTKLFPPLDTSGFKPSASVVKDRIVTKKFVFPVTKIAALREKYTAVMVAEEEADEYPRPTRIEALSTFIWSRFAAATETKADSSKLHTMLHAVNLRTRTEPPLPTNYFGNISGFATAVPCMEDDQDLQGGIIRKMRRALRGIDSDYVKKLGEGENHLKYLIDRRAKASKGELVTLNFTSLCRFPMYEVDFGWGKPIWAGSATMLLKNLIVFLDTKSGDGIEAWLNLKEEDMHKIEMDQELFSYVCP